VGDQVDSQSDQKDNHNENQPVADLQDDFFLTIDHILETGTGFGARHCGTLLLSCQQIIATASSKRKRHPQTGKRAK
jgi:hypothetical protein